MSALEDRVATFLEFACWDHQAHGMDDHRCAIAPRSDFLRSILRSLATASTPPSSARS